MKVYKITRFWIFLFCVLSSCSDDYEEQTISTGELREISFYPESSSIPNLRNYNPDWPWFDHFMTGERIGVFAVERDTQGGRAFAHNKCFVFDGERFIPMSWDDRILVRNEQLDFYAYYPFTPQMNYRNNIIDFTVSPYQDRDFHEDYPWPFRENNLMSAQYTEDLTGDHIPLVFRHHLALVNIDIYHGKDREVSAAVLPRRYIRNHFDLTEVERGFVPDTTRCDIHMFKADSYNGVSFYLALMPYQPIRKDSLFFRVTVSGKEYEQYADKTLPLRPDTYNYFKVTLPCAITLIGTVGGSVSGGGIHNCGDEVTVKAAMDQGCNFMGWYENDVKVSDYLHYKFVANGDRTLEARFYKL